jgi:hypothetical protein
MRSGIFRESTRESNFDFFRIITSFFGPSWNRVGKPPEWKSLRLDRGWISLEKMVVLQCQGLVGTQIYAYP